MIIDNGFGLLLIFYFRAHFVIFTKEAMSRLIKLGYNDAPKTSKTSSQPQPQSTIVTYFTALCLKGYK